MRGLELEPTPRKRALQASGRSLRTLFIVFASAAAGIFLLSVLGKWQANSHRLEIAPYTVDAEFVKAAAVAARPNEATENAVLYATSAVARRGKAAEFSSRDALLSELTAEAANDACFPTRADVIAESRPALTSLEAKIGGQRETVARAETKVADPEKPSAELKELKRATADLDSLLQQRDFLIDDLNLKVASVGDQQRRFYGVATDFIDRVVEVRRTAIETEVKAGKGPFAIGIEAAKAKHPLHVVYEATWYFSLIVVVLAIAFCVGSLLRVLPYPGSDEKWAGKMEELAERPKGEASSPVATWLTTAAALGISAVAATHAMREAPGSPLNGASYMDAIPFTRIESPVQPTTQTPSSYTINTPPVPKLDPTFALNQPITFSRASASVQIKPQTLSASITGMDQLEPDIRGFKDEAGRTNDALQKTKESLDTEIKKAKAFEQLVTDAKSSWGNVATQVATEGQLIRNALVTADFNDDQRQLAQLDYATTASTHRVWRTFLALARYRVTPATVAVFDAEPICGDKRLHEALRRSLLWMRQWPDATYKAPFTDTVINNMLSATIDRDTARAELQRHIAVILQASRTAE